MKTLGNGYMQMRFFFFTRKPFIRATLSENWFMTSSDFSWTKPQTKLCCLALILRKRSGSIKQLSFFCCSYFSEITKHYLLILQSFHSLVIVNGDKGHINNYIFFSLKFQIREDAAFSALPADHDRNYFSHQLFAARKAHPEISSQFLNVCRSAAHLRCQVTQTQ